MVIEELRVSPFESPREKSVGVGTDDLAPGSSRGAPGLQTDRVLDELDAAVAEHCVHPAGMAAPGCVRDPIASELYCWQGGFGNTEAQ